MKKICAIFLALTLMLATTVISVSAAKDINFSLTADVQQLEVDGKVKISVTYDPSLSVNCGDVYIKYNPELVKFNNAKAPEIYDEDLDDNIPITINANKGYATDTVKIANSAGDYAYNGTILTATFTALANGKADFELVVEKVKDIDFNSYDTITTTGVSVQIGSASVEEEKFEISATKADGNVVVTAENIDKAVGEGIKVYVATYAGGVLVNCQEQALKEGAMTFTGLADASARVFVWDKYNVPVADVTIQ